MAGSTLSGGTVSLPVKPNTAGFGALLNHGILAQTGGLSSIGAALGKKLLAGFAAVEIGVKVGEFISDSVKQATIAEAAQTKLSTTIKNAGSSYANYATQIEEAEKSGRKFGFTNSQTMDALSQLTLGLKDPAKALDVLSVAQDLAKAKGMDLTSAALLVTKGMEGQIRPLRALGIDIPVYAGNSQVVALAQDKVAAAQQKVNDILAKTPDAANASSKAHEAYTKATTELSAAQETLNEKQNSGDEILKALSDRLSGQASAAAGTLKGKQDALNAGWDDFKEKIGNKALPILSDLVGYLNVSVLPAVTGFLTWVQDTPAAIPTLVAGIALITSAFVALDIAMAANPVGAVIAGLAVAIAGIVAFDSFMTANLTTIAIWEFAIVGAIASVAEQVAEAFDNIANSIINGFLIPINAIRSAVGLPAVKVAVNFAGSLEGVVEAAQSRINVLKNPKGDGVAATGPKAMADGGTVLPTPGGTLVRVAEAGRSETVVDTESLNRAVAKRQGGDTYNVYESTSAYATAMQVSRIQNARKA